MDYAKLAKQGALISSGGFLNRAAVEINWRQGWRRFSGVAFAACCLAGCASLPWDRAVDDAGDDYFTLSEVDVKPAAVFTVQPIYPASLRGLGRDVEVIVSFLVDSKGRARTVAAEPAERAEEREVAFDESAVTALQQWRFRPGVKGGHPVNVACRIPVWFRSVTN